MSHEEGIAFFSGGKDGLYAVHLAERKGIKIPYLLTLKTTIGLSPHRENLGALETLAGAIGKKLLTFDMAKGSDALAEFIGSLGVDYIIAGDVLLEDHLRWVERLARKAGVTPFEPLWERDTEELAVEMLEAGFEYAMIAVNKEKLDRAWLGYTFRSVRDLELFLDSNPSVDPIGEMGEFHTVVLRAPLFQERFVLEVFSTEESERYYWLKFRLVGE
ncbi:PAB0415 family putative ATP pyrophosphatase [Thermococcus camini]|uniref:ATP pyrophosphatase n=1 Tax=Thermococcus camini TaxID=2016373 RepID=A0A7G2D6Q3_9EURY|nr:diphthine--ammonia ligase [Thermococcus camini]CAD5244235.1 ATP pyrophosphatase [Thermococcus camini]